MNSETIQFFKTRLTMLLDALNEQGPLKIKPNRDAPSEKTDEDHQPLNEMLQTIASNRNRNHNKIKVQIEDALEVIDRYPDEYGLCVACEDPIGHRRLLMMPYVQMCVRCQEASEVRSGGRRRHLTDYSS
ncbi:MAG: TraR/DksA C4-type zinc finger protein [Myxococcota bacterium]|nr:TraR/DksA C4-type zinc finger protein [Myxococcota bacterium]